MSVAIGGSIVNNACICTATVDGVPDGNGGTVTVTKDVWSSECAENTGLDSYPEGCWR
jgi:hypothetical protein